MRDELAVLREGFDYDLWANRKWLTFLETKGRPDPDWKIFRHILAAQEIWLRRCQGESPGAMPEPEGDESTMFALRDAWTSALERGEDAVVTYRRTTGEALSNRLSRIARHVVDHGAYHRGELRGLCRSRGDEDFPEAGLIGYYLEAGLTG